MGTTPCSAQITLKVPAGVAACFWVNNLSFDEMWELLSATEGVDDGHSEYHSCL